MKHNFKKLEIWKNARRLVKLVYQVSSNFPKEEMYGLTSQIRRAAVSMPSNISEGCGRNSDQQLIHFLGIAIGSNCELETQLYLAYDLEFIDETLFEETRQPVEELRKMMVGFAGRLVSEGRDWERGDRCAARGQTGRGETERPLRFQRSDWETERGETASLTEERGQNVCVSCLPSDCLTV